ncbi:hypothetical protein T4A_14501 [Trichinella pseudospiralis]|nr:hypothetical protein T4A_14501 [Trichinella pseudospiralis]
MDALGVPVNVIWTSNHPEWNTKRKYRRRLFLLKYAYALNGRAEYINNTLKFVQAYKKNCSGAEDRKVKNYTRRHAAQSTLTKSAPTAIASQASPKIQNNSKRPFSKGQNEQ